MSAAACDKAPTEQEAGSQLVGSLTAGVTLLLLLTVVQRGVGFVRNILFCRLLTDDQLGQWSLAYSFLLLMAPLAVCGIPGSLGRYVERHRQQGTLRSFLRRTTIASTILACVAIAVVAVAPRSFAWIVFRDAAQQPTMLVLAVSLAAVVAFNFLTELLMALRCTRAASSLQLLNSLAFALLGCGLIMLTAWGPMAVIAAYAAAAAIGAVTAIAILWSVMRGIRDEAPAPRQRDMWSVLVPFAAWVWVINLLSNLFDAADRYMILHFGVFDAHHAQALIGQYHSSRVVPMLLVGVASMLASALLPYLSHDWEQGDRASVSRRLNLAIKLTGVGFTAGGAAILLGSPILFTWLLAGRYDEGLSVLPVTMAYCVWISLLMIAQSYLWCAEKARLSGLALAAGLAANIVLNALLLPLWGLMGAVVATAAGNAGVLVLVLLLNRRQGMQLDWRVWLACTLPLALCLPPLLGAVVIALFALLAWRRNWLFNADEKRQLRQIASGYEERIRRLFHHSFLNTQVNK